MKIKQNYRCEKHGTPLEVSRGKYYCPTCIDEYLKKKAEGEGEK